MRRFRIPFVGGAAALLLAACGGTEPEADATGRTMGAEVQRGIDMAVEDVLRAEKAASAPLPEAAPRAETEG